MLLNPIKAPNSVMGTFNDNHNRKSTKMSLTGTILARLVSMYSHISITNSVLAKNSGNAQLEIIASSIQ